MTGDIFFFFLSRKKAAWNHISPNKQHEPFLSDFENTTSKFWFEKYHVLEDVGLSNYLLRVSRGDAGNYVIRWNYQEYGFKSIVS